MLWRSQYVNDLTLAADCPRFTSFQKESPITSPLPGHQEINSSGIIRVINMHMITKILCYPITLNSVDRKELT